MKMVVMWLLGVPVAVTFFFAAFAVDASKIAARVENSEAKQVFSTASAATPGRALSSKTETAN